MRKLLASFFLLSALFFASACNATISRIGTSTGTNTCTPTAHAIGDIIVISAFRNTTTAPTLAAGYTSILTKSGTLSSMRIGWRIATATNDAGGTWTNATSTVCHVYRSSSYATGGSVVIGASASNSATTNTVNYPALTLFHTDNTSWILGFAGVGNLTETVATAPAGMTNQSLETAAATQTAGHDTNGTVTSWASTNATTTGTAGNSVSATVELIENQPGASITNIVQHLSFGYSTLVTANEPANLLTYTFDPSLSANSFVVAVAYPSGATPTITDNNTCTWTAAGAAADAGAGNMALKIFVCPSATAGTSKITVSFGGTPQIPVKMWVTQLFNITATVNGYVQAAGVNAGGVISPGSMTPTNNNANGGNLVLSYTSDSAQLSTTGPALFIPETGYSLNDADISWGGASGLPNASQFFLQATSAATTPRFYLNIGGTETYNVAAVALSVGTQGTAAPSGAGVAPWINRICYFAASSSPASWKLQIPSTGNAGLMMTWAADGTGPSISSVVDSDAVTWTKQNPTTGAPYGFTNVNQTPKTNRQATVALTGSGSTPQIIYYDISNAATAPVVATAGVAPTGANNVGTIGSQPSITPTGTNQLTVAYMNNFQGPSTNVALPAGAVADLPNVSIWQGTGTIAGTTLTTATTTWGGINSGGGIGILSGSGVTVGTTIQSGTGPTYTITPSQTVSSAVTMNESGTDGDTINLGDVMGHYFNGGSTAAIPWGWNFGFQPSNSVASFAVTLAGPPAGVGSFVANPSVVGIGP